MEEIWKDIENYEGLYQVSNMGNVRSLDRYVKHRNGKNGLLFKKGQTLKPSISNSGYVRTELGKNGKKKTFSAHRLVALAFLEKEDYQNEVNHINGVKTDNAIENLEWCNRSENEKHAHRTGLKVPLRQIGSKHPQSILTEKDILEIDKLIKSGMVFREIAEKFNVSKSAISSINIRKSWKHVPKGL